VLNTVWYHRASQEHFNKAIGILCMDCFEEFDESMDLKKRNIKSKIFILNP